MNDLTGQRYGRLVAIKPIYSKNKYIYWLCQCDCGNQCEVNGHFLKRGSTKSCGCLRKDLAKNKADTLLHNPIHGLSHTRISNIHNNMIQRCYNPNNHKYKNYGGRGISICDEWLGKNGLINFNNWARANGYQDDLSIDRIDVNGNYEPSNCRWTNNIVQGNNRTNNTIYDFRGIKHTQKEWSEILGCSRSTINRAIKRGLSFEEFAMKYKAGQKVIELLQKG